MSIVKRKTHYYVKDLGNENSCKKCKTTYYIKDFENDIKIVKNPIVSDKLVVRASNLLRYSYPNINEIAIPRTPDKSVELLKPPPIKRQPASSRNLCDFIEKLIL